MRNNWLGLVVLAVFALLTSGNVFHNKRAIAQSGMSAHGPSAFFLDDYYLVSDGEDYAPAFNRLMTDPLCAPPASLRGAAQRDRVGCKVTLGHGVYPVRSTITVCRQMTIEGAGGGFWGAATVLQTPDGVTAFKIAFYDECRQLGKGDGGTGTLISDLAVLSQNGNSSIPSYGVWAEASFKGQNLWIRGFTQGIRISADVHRTPRTNANLWHLEDVRLDSNDHAGLFVDGGDSNAGFGDLVSSSSNCQKAGTATDWDAMLGPCANIIMSDFLGSTLVAAHTATARNLTTGEIFPGYIFEGDSQRGTCINCYSESDQATNEISRNSQVLGGLGKWKGYGLILQGGTANRLSFVNRLDPDNVAELRLGEAASSAAFLAARVTGADGKQKALPFRMKYESSNASYRFDVANLNSAAPLRIGALGTSPEGLGGLWLSKTPIYLGQPGHWWCPDHLSTEPCP